MFRVPILETFDVVTIENLLQSNLYFMGSYKYFWLNLTIFSLFLLTTLMGKLYSFCQYMASIHRLTFVGCYFYLFVIIENNVIHAMQFIAFAKWILISLNIVRSINSQQPLAINGWHSPITTNNENSIMIFGIINLVIIVYTFSASDSSSARSTIMLTTSYLNAFIIYGSILLSIGSLLSLKLHHSSW